MDDKTTALATSIIPLDFTHVFYDAEDKLSLLMAVLSLVPQLLLVVYATLILSRREAETGLMFAGQIASEVVNEWCKKQFKQERPRCKFLPTNLAIDSS